MNRHSQLWPSIVAVVVFAIAMGSADAQSAKDLVGTWTLVSISGDPDGPNPRFGSSIDLGLGQPVGMARARPAGLESVGREALRPPGPGKCASAASCALIPRVEHACLVASMAT